MPVYITVILILMFLMLQKSRISLRQRKCVKFSKNRITFKGPWDHRKFKKFLKTGHPVYISIRLHLRCLHLYACILFLNCVNACMFVKPHKNARHIYKHKITEQYETHFAVISGFCLRKIFNFVYPTSAYYNN